MEKNSVLAEISYISRRPRIEVKLCIGRNIAYLKQETQLNTFQKSVSVIKYNANVI